MGCGCKERREKMARMAAIAAERAKIVFEKAKAKLKTPSN
jgi:hypothetical protein